MPRESLANKRQRAKQIVATLRQAYPNSTCALRHDSPWQLLVATALSAQTTDVKVNEVTRNLFARWPTADLLGAASVEDVGNTINSIGLWRGKAQNIVALSAILADQGFTTEVPQSVDALIQLPGVGRKTATAVLGTAYNLAAGITVDTHMLRINALLKLSTAHDPVKMATDLERMLPEEEWNHYTHLAIDHGRVVCVARRPRCGVCPLSELCPSAGKGAYQPRFDDALPASAKNVSWA